MNQPWLIPVSGFLGAGKTTLILAAANLLHERGLKCAAILNDQGDRLVDTAFIRQRGVAAAEVTGACFCCHFSDLIAAAEQLRRLTLTSSLPNRLAVVPIFPPPSCNR